MHDNMIHFSLPSFLFVHSSFHLFVYSFINYTITVYLCCISPPHTRLPRLTKKNPINKKHQKNQGSDTVLFTWKPRPVYCTCQVMDSPTGQGDTVITQGSVTVPLGGKRARSVMYLTVNIQLERESAIYHCKQSLVLVCQHNTYI